MGRPKKTRPMPWLRQRLRAVNANATALARHLKIPPSRVYEMINGQRQFQAHEIPLAAMFLKIGEASLLKLIDGSLDTRDISINSMPMAVPWTNVGGDSVPLLRATLSLHDRWMVHAAEEQGALLQPDPYRFSPAAFALVVQDERNSPVYRAQDRILIDPESLAIVGNDVVLSSATAWDEHKELHVIAGRLEGASDEAWSLRQYATQQVRSYARKQFPRAWKIVGRFIVQTSFGTIRLRGIA